jgi:hypothetical protein
MRVGLMVAVLAVAVSAPAMAQVTPSVEIGLGYAYMRDEEIDESFPLGWYADIAGNVNDWLGLVAEVGGSYKTISEEGFEEFDVDVSVHTLMGGLRLNRRGDSANFYLQVLAGGAKAKVSLLDASESVTDFALQPGIGLEFGGNTRLRIGADYRRIFSEGQGTDEWRATAGIVFGLGG